MTKKTPSRAERPGRRRNLLETAVRVVALGFWWTVTGQLKKRLSYRANLYRSMPSEAYRLPRLFNADGTLAGWTPPLEADAVFMVPFGYKPVLAKTPRIAVVCPTFYSDLAADIAQSLRAIPVPFDCFLSTDTEEKAAEIRTAFSTDWTAGAVDVRVMPNRGRDIGPKLAGFRDIYDRYDYVLFLHSKRSTHAATGSDWRRYLFATLIGSPEIVMSILAAFERDPMLGMIFPQHWRRVSGSIHWAYNYPLGHALGRRLGFEIEQDRILEFPAGSMFWLRAAALKPLLDLDLGFDDFPEEKGQVDGTIAHAIERLMLYSCEGAGFTWAKIADPALLRTPSTKVEIADERALDSALRTRAVLITCAASAGPSTLELDDPRLQPLRFTPDDGAEPRLTLIVSERPENGIGTRRATVLDLFERIGRIKGQRLRILACGEEDEAWIGALRARYATDADRGRPEIVVVPPGLRRWTRLMVQAQECFVADTWQDAAAALSLIDDQRRFFRRGGRLVYDVLDVTTAAAGTPERAFAERLLMRGEDVVALVGSAALGAALSSGGYRFRDQIFLRPAWSAAAAPAAKAEGPPAIVVPWRPKADPDGAKLVVAALDRWQRRQPFEAAPWEIRGLGEPGADVALPSGVRIRLLGTPDAEAYGESLRGARAGLVPQLCLVDEAMALEMAAFGLKVATNRLAGCDPARAGAAFAVAPSPSAHDLAAALSHATEAALRQDSGEKTGDPAREIAERAFASGDQMEQAARWVSAQL